MVGTTDGRDLSVLPDNFWLKMETLHDKNLNWKVSLAELLA